MVQTLLNFYDPEAARNPKPGHHESPECGINEP